MSEGFGESKVGKIVGQRAGVGPNAKENCPPECGNCSDSDFPPKADKTIKIKKKLFWVLRKKENKYIKNRQKKKQNREK